MPINVKLKPLLQTGRWVVTWFVIAFSAAAAGATSDPEATLDRLHGMTESSNLSGVGLSKARVELDVVVGIARDASRNARAKALAVRDILKVLGPPPADGEPAESDRIRKRRRELTASLGELDSAAKQAELIIVRGDAIVSDLDARQRSRTQSGYLVRSAPPYRWHVWMAAVRQIAAAVSAVRQVRHTQSDLSLLALLTVGATLTLVGIGVGLLSRRFLIRYGRDESIAEPSYARRSVAAVCVSLSRGVLPAVVFSGLFAIAWVYYLRPALAPETSAPVSVFVAVVTYLFGSGLARAAFAPSMPQWRLVPISEQSSVQIGRGIHLLLAVVTLNVVIQFAFDAVNLTALRAPDLASVKSFLVTSLVAVLLMMLCMPRLWQVPQSVAVSDGVGHSSHSNNWLWPVARLLVALAALAMLFASLLGYRLVADFILNATVSTLGLLAVAFGLHALCSEGLNLLLARDFGPAAAVKRLLALSEDGAKSLNFWLTAVVDFALFVVSVAGVLAFWGVPLTDMWSATLSLAQGIQVGSYKLSLIDMALAVMVFGVVVGVTRLIQRFFERLLPRTRLDIGMRTAVSAALGYIGVSIALLVAISTLGIDLTKLALIAGALSVGIGFGLQNIVNNFVSGLILLIERPVKIGDWVVIGDIEGTVKQINVRSTLIETFNHADVIIPNSDLLQTALVNWTHRNRLGRVDIAVGVSYSSNVEKVEQALLACAEEHARILRWPAPQVLFMDFGASSLDFQLRVHIADIEERLAVSSDVRKAVIRVFRAQNIEIPFPQTDVWMRMPNAVPRDDG